MIVVYCDGSITSHTGVGVPRCWLAWFATCEGVLIHHKTFDMGENPDYSATTAEYAAIRSALHWLSAQEAKPPLIIRSDSEVAIKQLLGEYRCHSKNLQPYLAACQHLAQQFPAVTYQWIPREKNKIADILTKCCQEKGGGRELTHDEVAALISGQGF